MEILRKYGVATHIYIPIIKRAVVDFAVSADWTPAAGDVKISKDGGAAANVTNLPTAITMGNTAMWDFSMTATEMQAAKVMVTVADAATKAVEDQMFIVATYGNASAEHAVDLDDSVRAGLTALPNAAAEAAGGLLTRGSGAGQINQDANGRIDTRTVAMAADVITAAALAADAGAEIRSLASGVADSGTTTTMVDAARTEADVDYWKGQLIVFTSGTLLGQARLITAFDPTTDTITFAPATTVAVGTHSYEIHPRGRVDLHSWLGAVVNALLSGRVDASSILQLDAVDSTAIAASGSAEIADKLLGRNIAGGSDGGRTVTSALRRIRNKVAIAAGTATIYQEDDATPDHTAAVATTAGDPISSWDPA